MLRRILHAASSWLIVGGAVLLLGTAVLYAYGEYERGIVEAQIPPTPAIPTEAPTATPEPTATTTPVPTASSTPALTATPVTATPTATATTTPAPSATATPTPVPLPARRIIIPRIKLDSPVVEAVVQNGEWVVPRFVAGHLEGTALPGEGSNVVLTGHVDSINSGNVFARLDQLQSGDVITLVTEKAVFDYRVVEKRVVRNTDISVVLPTNREQVTLITCTGTWLPLQRDFDSRLIIIGTPAKIAPPDRSLQ